MEPGVKDGGSATAGSTPARVYDSPPRAAGGSNGSERAEPSGTGGGSGSYQHEKYKLVQTIQDGQRQNPSFKDAWALYSDTHCKGVRDPSRLSADVLRRFLTERGVAAGADYGSAASGANRAY